MASEDVEPSGAADQCSALEPQQVELGGCAPGPTLVYDGDCRLCRGLAAWMSTRTGQTVATIPYQRAPLEDLGLGLEEAESQVWLVGPRHRSGGPVAVGELLLASRGWTRVLGRLILAPPLRPLSRRVYLTIASRRGLISWPGCRACRTEGVGGGGLPTGPERPTRAHGRAGPQRVPAGALGSEMRRLLLGVRRSARGMDRRLSGPLVSSEPTGPALPEPPLDRGPQERWSTPTAQSPPAGSEQPACRPPAVGC